TFEDSGITLREHFGCNRLLDGFFDFALRGPEVGEVDGVAVFAVADGVFAEIGVDASGEGEGDDQGRRHQIVGADFRVDAAFEVAIAGEDAGDDQIFFVDGFGDFFRQRAGVADAGGATV